MAARHASTHFDRLLLDDSFEGRILLDEPMSKHTTYRIGGSAKAFVEANTISALGSILNACKEDGIAWCPVGKGSNLLVSDEGFDGVAVSLAGDFRNWRFDEELKRVTVGAGTILSRLVQEVFHQGYSGMEFAVGTPGTVGGAIRMNAGTMNDWIGTRVVSVTAFKPEVGLVRYAASDIEWGYRSTSFAPNEVILECELQLETSFSGNIHEKMASLLARRKDTQPLNYPSCGSVFRNPEGHSAGALIDQTGLKGTVIGGAQISEKHANFIVNIDNASASDVRALIDLAKSKVKEQFGIELQTEVRFLGFAE